MKVDIHYLQDTLKISFEQFAASREEAKEVNDLYHNRHYTISQLSALKDKGQPAETFNVIKMFGRLLVGYYSTVTNGIEVRPVQRQDMPTASLLNGCIRHVFNNNDMDTIGDNFKLSGLLDGLIVCYYHVEDTGEFDDYGRPIRQIKIDYIPPSEVALDPMSRKPDYSDARYFHRYKWIDEESLRKAIELSGGNSQQVIDRLAAYDNHLNEEGVEFSEYYKGHFVGRYKQYDNYLVVHSIVNDGDDTYSILWSGDEIIYKNKLNYSGIRFPYRVQKINDSDICEYYGIFREVVQSQHAINQALLKLQTKISSEKILVEKDAVENLDKFVEAYSRVNGIVEVKHLSGIKVEQLSVELQNQYIIIDRALNRIQKILGINDSFLGMAFASDSGRKVKLQQNAAIIALRYFNTKLEQFYKGLGMDVANLVKQYYTAEQALRLNDESVGETWLQINQPIKIPIGIDPETGGVQTYTPLEEVLDPETGEPMQDEEGNYIIAPMPRSDSEIAFTDVDVLVTTIAYDDEREQNQILIESIINGSIGQILAGVDPTAFLKIASFGIRQTPTRHSIDIARVIEETIQKLSPQQQQAISQMAMANQMQQGGSQIQDKRLTNGADYG